MGYSTENIDPHVLRAAREFVHRLASRHPVETAILFGSRARQTGRPDSDIDIAIVLRGPRRNFVDTKLDMVDVAYDTLLEEGLYIQPLPIWEDQWDRPETHSNPQLLHNIERDGIPL